MSMKEARQIENIPASELDLLLSKFFISVHKQDGSEYEPATLSCFQRSFQRHLHVFDVFVLALRREPELCGNVSFVTGKGRNCRAIKLEPIVQALGEARTAALPAFHVLCGADNTGCFSGHAKPLCWKAFLNVDEDVVREMAKLGTTLRPSDETMKAIEKFVCELYVPNTSLTMVKDLRWWLFRKKQAQSERLPLTQGALRQAVLRAHYQAMLWNNDVVANPDIPSPKNYGWEKK